ncbi:MAG TPA: SCP2 sterol-binding domain-containing protein [Candidatus Methylomirabilis sp.]|nr:SCP2 sterol-binding domain-containing protein [Candidatus Methylomirabilis sp.]
MPPHPLLLPLRLIPDAAHAQLLARVFNHLLRGQRVGARLSELDGKSVCIHIKDALSMIYFRIEHGRLQPGAPGQSDVCISGTLEDFWRLATRGEDPDTLFFSRRLSIEGDTETGVHVKNLLDALDYDWAEHFRAVLGDTFGGAAHDLLDRTLGRLIPRRCGH